MKLNPKWTISLLGIGVLTLIIVKTVMSQVTLPPLVALATEPLYMNGAKTKANLTLALSVEFPTVGQTYRDNFDPTKTYIGYFDNKVCYRHVPANGGVGAYFDWTSAAANDGDCGGGGFNGNFMNWATSSAIDIMRYGLTGGNRVVDESNGSAKTVVERAYLPDNFYRNSSYFSEKVLPRAYVSKFIEQSAANKIGNNDMYIYNCRDRVYFAKEQDTTGGCTNPFGVANAQSDKLAGPNNNDTYYEVRNLVCDANSASNRLMSYDPGTKKWSGLCFRYPNGKYKPVGQFQMNADNLRISVFGYLQDNSRSRNGGVMRAPLKYLGPRQYDSGSNLMAAANPVAEWDANTGVFIDNPQGSDATYGAQGHPKSGAIMYINKFGTLDSNNIGLYKSLDPMSELYYEALRYLQGLQPNSNPVELSGTATEIRKLKENFPVYSTWTDPFTGFVDSDGTQKSCLRNSILGIADVFTHSDATIPGNTRTTNSDSAVSAVTNPALNVETWTGIVGSFEANSGTTYVDGQGRNQVANNIAINSPYYPGLANAATANTGSTGGTFYMAGLAYWANTHSFRTDIPKARITTYAIDVNERRDSDVVNNRRQRQLYLAAKYGGFDDNLAGGTGNPYKDGSNVLWQGSDGDAKNYFLVSDAQKFLDSISEVFAKVVEETGSIAGGAISTTRVSSNQASAVFQARFNPVANYWSGRLFKFPLVLSTGGDLSISETETWEASKVITTITKTDNGTNRNIVIGSPIGQQGTIQPTPFKWANLTQSHKDALNMDINGVVDTNGEFRLNYLRGDQRKELNATNPTGIFRPRDAVLGDIVNSGLVYMGKPSSAISGASYADFYRSASSRKPVIFANANDGMLHAIYDTDGKEAFAYIPGFLASKLKNIPDLDYLHTSMADATPAVGEAYVNSAWKSVLVSGVGGGAQGIYALDVSNPETFTKDNVLWEFTERDSSALGNVMGAPQIVKLRVQDATSTSPTYKWYAIVASGVNNYAADGYAHSTGDPSLFILDLETRPSATSPWTEGVNFWRIELPQTSTTIAKGAIGFSVVKNFAAGNVDTIYAGDLQGNVWALDFTQKGVSSLTTTALNNLKLLNAMGVTTTTPFFIAKDSASKLQPITTEPTIVNGMLGERAVAFGTGKYLEPADTTVPLATGASFYTLFDRGANISARSALQAGTVNTDGTVTVTDFAYSSKKGWYIDFDKTLGERQISDITAVFGKFMFGSLYPTRGSCGEGGGRFYILDSLTGDGGFIESQVGILASPLVLEVGDPSLTKSDTTGRRIATQKIAVITQGSKGLKIATTSSYSFPVGRLSWRQINNFQENKQAP